jgi:hypothetical protein
MKTIEELRKDAARRTAAAYDKKLQDVFIRQYMKFDSPIACRHCRYSTKLGKVGNWLPCKFCVNTRFEVIAWSEVSGES